MAIETRFDPVNRFVVQAYSGANSMQDYVAGTGMVSALFSEHGVSKCILDLRNVDNQASIADVYDLPQLYVELDFPKHIRISILSDAMQKDASAIRFYETICLNRGWKAHISHDMESAIAWLAGEPGAKAS